MSNPYDPAKEPELTLTLDPFAQEVPTMEQPQAQMPAEKKEEPKPIFDESQLTEQERKELADSGSGGSSAKVPDSRVSAYNLEKYETVRKYLSGLDADEARVRVRNDPVVRDALTDYYYYKLYAEFGK